MDFFTEFVPQIWPIFLFLLLGPFLLVFLYVMMRRQSKQAKQRKLAEERAVAQLPIQKRTETPVIAAIDDDDDPLELLRQAREEAQQDEAEESSSFEELLQPVRQPALHRVAETPVKVALAGGNITSAEELLTILRDETDGRLMVQIGATAYRTLVNDAEAKRTFTRILKELSGVILTPDAAISAPEPQQEVAKEQPAAQKPMAETPSPAPVAPPPPSPRQAVKPTAPVSSASEQGDDDAEETEHLPGDLPDLRISDSPDVYKRDRFGRVSVQRVEKAPEVNIADAIEAYLQFRIEQNPQYQNRGIHIRPALHGGVRIEADGKSYDFVDEVTDPDVRQFLQQTIAEWQERQ